MALELLTPFTKVELQEEKSDSRHAVGLFWGAFNPVHVGHLTIADQVRQQLKLDHVLFLPEKDHDNHVSRMLELALGVDEQARADYKVDQCRLSSHRTIFDTVKQLTEDNPETDFYFIIGSDMIGTLSRWERIDELVNLVQFVGVRRPGYRAGTSYPLLWVDVPAMEISSTFIRQQLKRGISPNFLLAPKVIEYIKKEGLYV